MLKQQKEFQNKLDEKDREIAAKENEWKTKITEMEKEMLKQQNEFQYKLAEKDRELATSKNDFKLKLAEVENVNNLKIAEIENENKLKLLEKENKHKSEKKELKPEIVATANEVASIKDDVQKMQTKFEQLEMKISKLQRRVITRAERLAWGAGRFFESKAVEMNLFTSYHEWYKEISLLLLGEKEIVSSGTSKYVFMKRNCGICFENLYLITHRKGRIRLSENDRRYFYVEDDEKQFLKKTRFMLLHPLEHDKSLKMKESGQYDDNEQWGVDEITKDFYY